MASNKTTIATKSNFDSLEKIFSNTLKRNPKMELSKTDLLKLLTYLEGELQAREVVIATLKAERVKQLLYQAKYGQFSLNDPFAALQRDSYGAYNPNCDEASIKAMYNNQLSQVENLILQHRRAQQRLRQHLYDAEQQHAKVVAELEEEIRKHAQDTAQGDDVTYMLEKERERLHQEIELERQQNKKLEKELKKVVQALEQDKVRHKQIVMLLLEDRKRIVAKLFEEHSKNEEMAHFLTSEKGRMADVVEGLEEESKKSLLMEAELERQAADFVTEREYLKRSLQQAYDENRQLHEHIAKLSKELLELRQQQQRPHLNHQEEDAENGGDFRLYSSGINVTESRVASAITNSQSSTNSVVTSPPPPPAKPSILLSKAAAAVAAASALGTGESGPKLVVGRLSKSPSPVPAQSVSPQHSSTLIVGGIGTSASAAGTQSPTQSSTIVRTVRAITPTPSSAAAAVNHTAVSSEKPLVRSIVTAITGNVTPPPAPPPPPPPQMVQMTPRMSVSASPGTRVYTTTQGGKVTFHVSAAPQPPKKPQLGSAVVGTPPGAGRGTPPPIPPNKPVLLKKDGPTPGQLVQHTVVTTAIQPNCGSPSTPPLKIASATIPGGGLKFGITISKGSSDSNAVKPAGSIASTSSPASYSVTASHLVVSSAPSTTVGGATVVAATSTPHPGSSEPQPSQQIFKETQQLKTEMAGQPIVVTAFSAPPSSEPLGELQVDPPVVDRQIDFLNLSPRKTPSSPSSRVPSGYHNASFVSSASSVAGDLEAKRSGLNDRFTDVAADVLAPELADFQQLLVSMATAQSSSSTTGHSFALTTSDDSSDASSTTLATVGISPKSSIVDTHGLELRSASPMGRLSAMLEQWKLDRGSGTGSSSGSNRTSCTNGNGGSDGGVVTVAAETSRTLLKTQPSKMEDDVSDSKRPKLTGAGDSPNGRRAANFTPHVRKVVSPTLPKSFNNMKL